MKSQAQVKKQMFQEVIESRDKRDDIFTGPPPEFLKQGQMRLLKEIMLLQDSRIGKNLELNYFSFLLKLHLIVC